MSDLVTASGPWFAVAVTMVHTLWVGAIVGAAAVVSRMALRGAGASVRYAVALAWLGVLAMVPVGVGVWVARGAVVEETRTGVGAVEVQAREESGAALRGVPRRSAPASIEAKGEIGERGEGTREVVGGKGTVAGWLENWRGVATVLPAVWLLGAAGMLGWSLMGLVGAERLRRGAVPADAEVEGLVVRLARRMRARSVAVMLCDRVRSPVLVGIVKPVILLPTALVAELSPGQLEMILVHELAHVRRWDNLVNLLQRVVESVLFFQPAVWVVSAWVRQEREHCCDDAVVAAAGAAAREEYAGVLVSINQWRAGWAVAGSAAGGGDLVSRIRRIITRRDSMRVSRACIAALVVPAVLSGVWLAWAAAPAGEGSIVTVTKEGGEHKTIQAAIDAAPDGAVVRIGPGEWQEGLVIKKAVTLEGAGWEKTTLTAAVPVEARAAAKELARAAEKGLSVGEWKARVDALSQKYQAPAVIRVEGARGVVIRGLKAAGSPGPNPDGKLYPGMVLVAFERSAGRVENCVVAGSPGNGINISGGSDVEIRHTLVAGVWSTGIQIGSRDGGPARAVVADSDVRNCYHRGIVIAPGTDVTVEGCRIWGSAWHGIRYDNASPTIRGNRIYNVARSGIYASGDTHATVTGNLFWNNEMDGVSCWFANQDAIEGNTFASNQREGMGVTGGAKPALTRNLFVGNPVAIIRSYVNGDKTAVGEPKLDGNWFWNNGVDMLKPGEKDLVKVDLSPETRSRTEEVWFADAAKGDFSLPAGSPAREAKVGVANPLTEASPFPAQAEEKAIAPEGGSWDYQKWKKG